MVKPIGSRLATKQKPGKAPGLAKDEPDPELRILAAARAEFISKGLVGARMQAIASEAGVNKALLHYYFRSKSKLYETVLRQILQAVWQKIRLEIQPPKPAKDLESLVRTIVTTYIRTLSANPDFPPFMIHELASGGEYLKRLTNDLYREIGPVSTELLKAYATEIKQGKIQPMDPLHFLLNLTGMCLITFLAIPVLNKIGPPIPFQINRDEKFVEARINAIVTMIFSGLRSPR